MKSATAAKGKATHQVRRWGYALALAQVHVEHAIDTARRGDVAREGGVRRTARGEEGGEEAAAEAGGSGCHGPLAWCLGRAETRPA